METVLPTGPKTDHAADITAWLAHRAPLFADAGVECALLAELGMLRDELAVIARMRAKCGECDFRPDQLAADARVLDRLVGRGALSVVGADDGTPRYRLTDADRVAHATELVTLTAWAVMPGVERDVADIRYARPGDPLFPLALAVVLADAIRRARLKCPLFNRHAADQLVADGLCAELDYSEHTGNCIKGQVIDFTRARARLVELYSTNPTLYGTIA